MTLPSASPLPTTIKAPRARRRRAKRGVVAAYIHDISPRHRAAPPSVAVPPVAPSPSAPAKSA